MQVELQQIKISEPNADLEGKVSETQAPFPARIQVKTNGIYYTRTSMRDIPKRIHYIHGNV